MKVIKFERRHFVRKPVSFPAVATCGNAVLTGMVRDMSDGGLFFEPEVGFAEGWSQGNETQEILLAGDKVVISFPETSLQIEGEIRWGGSSSANNCWGLGVKTKAETLRSGVNQAA